jgi:hypothetical protein
MNIRNEPMRYEYSDMKSVFRLCTVKIVADFSIYNILFAMFLSNS